MVDTNLLVFSLFMAGFILDIYYLYYWIEELVVDPRIYNVETTMLHLMLLHVMHLFGGVGQ